MLDIFDSDECYLNNIYRYFERDSSERCFQCSNCNPDLKVTVKENGKFKVVKVKRKKYKKKAKKAKKTKKK